MYYVYVLQNMSDVSDVYIGYTHNLRERLREHHLPSNRGYTRGKRWRLVYYESYLSESDARSRERRLKQDGRARYRLMRRIQGSLTVD